MVAEVIFSRDGSGDHVRPLLPGCLPPAVFGIPIEQVPLPLLKRRNLLLYLLAAEAIVSFLCLGVGAHRSGIARVSIGLNLLCLSFAILGFVGVARFRDLLIIFHSVTVAGVLAMFVLFVLASLMFGKGDSGGNWIVLVVFIFMINDVLVATLTGMFAWDLYQLEKQSQSSNASSSGGRSHVAPVSAAALPVAQPVPVDGIVVASTVAATSSKQSNSPVVTAVPLGRWASGEVDP